MSHPLDIAALRARLQEYEPSSARCPNKVEEVRDDAFLYHPCGRPAGHEGACGNVRMVLGFPGYASLAALLDEVERLRANAEARERVMRREADLLRAAQREVDELRGIYAALRQTSADLCVVCGWRFFVPGVGCQGCERARLEAEVDALRLQRVLDNQEAARLYDFARDKGQAMERAAVVAWLREEYDTHSTQDAADYIERGEHRSEGEP